MFLFDRGAEELLQLNAYQSYTLAAVGDYSVAVALQQTDSDSKIVGLRLVGENVTVSRL